MSAFDLLDPAPLPRRVLLARRVMLATALAIVASNLLYGLDLEATHVYVEDPVQVWAIESEDGFVALVRLTTVSFHRVSLEWNSDQAVDEVLLLREGDLERMLAGDAIEPLARFPGGRGGVVAVDSPGADCSGPNGACLRTSLPLVAWIRGTGWEGRSLESARSYSIPVHQDPRTARHWQTPLMVDMVSATASTYRAQTPFVAFGLGLMATGAVAGAVHLLGMRHVRREGRTSPESDVLRAATTEDLLVLSRLSVLYHESLRRQFLLAALVILLAAGTAMALALPVLLGSLERLYPWGGAGPARAILWLTGPFLAALAFCAWWSSYDRVRDEIKRWREAARRLRAELAGVLEG